MIGTSNKPSTIRRPSSRETITLNNSRLTNGTTNGLSRPTIIKETTTNRLGKIDSTPAPTSRTTTTCKPSSQMHYASSTQSSRRLANGTTINNNNNNKDSQNVPKTESKLTAKRNEINSTSVRKNVAPPSTLNNTTTNTINNTTTNGNSSVLVTGTAKKSGTATARAATTLISLQKECDKYKRLADLYKRQLETSKGDVSKSVMVVDGLSVVVKYLTEHLNAFSTPSLKATIERQSTNYEKLKGDYSKLESLLEQMRQENTRKEDDLRDEIVRMSLEMVNEKKRHDNEKNRLFDMFEDQMEAQKKSFKREMEKIDEEKVNLEKVIDSLKDEITDKMNQIEGLTNRVSELESSLSMEKDRRCRMLQEKVKFMSSEIQSLKDVLDLKDGELRTLKTSIANEELLRQDLATAQQSITNLTQRLEQLEISANQKNTMINMLKEENESLRERYNREQRERRRISMKNEELEYTLSEFTTPSKGNSSSEDIFLTPMQPPPRTRLTLASVPPCRPQPTDSTRKGRQSYSVSRPSHHHTKCFQPSLSSTNILPSSSSSPSSSTETTTSTTLPCSSSSSTRHHHRRSSASTKLTFQDANDSEESYNQQTNNRNMDNHNTHVDGVFNLPDSDDEGDNDSVTTPNFEESNVYSPSSASKMIVETIVDDEDVDVDVELWRRNRRRARGRRESEQNENQNGSDDQFGASFSANNRNSSKNNLVYHNVSSSDDSSHGLNTTLVGCSQSSSSSPISTTSNHKSSNNKTNQRLVDQQVSSSSASSSTNGEGTSGIGSSLNSISVNSGVTFRSERWEDDSESESAAPKSLPSILPQSILDSGFEDIEGLIAFR
ncbi:probable WRKY transcription factor protein 1 isoform X2 [Panonychus citri]|nr:probable WRKY transcription factor protein 1 isoform X2 [Panonychus citri]